MTLASDGQISRVRQLWRQFLSLLYGIGWMSVLWLGLWVVLALQPTLTQGVAVGEISPRDIRAPESQDYVSELRTEQAREQAAREVPSVYTPTDRSRVTQQLALLEQTHRYLDTVRTDTTLGEERQREYVKALTTASFSDEAQTILLSMPEEAWSEVVNETQQLVDQTMRSEVRSTDLPDIREALPDRINPILNRDQSVLVTEWAQGMIRANRELDEEATTSAQQAARQGVEPVVVNILANEILVREGTRVTAEQIEALEMLGLQQRSRSWMEITGLGLLLLLLVLVFGFYINRIHNRYWYSPRVMGLMIFLLVGLAGGARFAMPGMTLLSFFYPVAFGAMIVSVLLGIDIGLLFTTLLAILIGYVVGDSGMMIYVFTGSAIASLLMWRVERLGSFVVAGVFVGVVNAMVVLALALVEQEMMWFDVAQRAGVAWMSGAASASLALAGFYVASSLLGITTFLQLMEMARPTHPLFRDLLLKAPGTYHHSIIVSNLAERAAEAVGADMLLVRVGAYYHDIGKMKNPHYFVENQTDGVNPHTLLDDPRRSSEIIIEHVTEGTRMARKHSLPRRITDMIKQHHGTTSTAFFYHKACDIEGKEAVNYEDFCYPGPIPDSRESGILMMADSVEATARALKPASHDDIIALVQKTITGKLGQGQLTNCDLTLRDLERIQRAFVEVLQGIYHPRITYPDRPLPQSAAAVLPGETAPDPSHDPSASRTLPNRA